MCQYFQSDHCSPNFSWNIFPARFLFCFFKSDMLKYYCSASDNGLIHCMLDPKIWRATNADLLRPQLWQSHKLWFGVVSGLSKLESFQNYTWKNCEKSILTKSMLHVNSRPNLALCKAESSKIHVIHYGCLSNWFGKLCIQNIGNENKLKTHTHKKVIILVKLK